MPISASQIFDFLDRQKAWNIDRHEIASPAFGTLRRSLRQIALRFSDSDDQLAMEVLDGIRTLLSEWLTVPVPFDHSILDAMRDLFGQVEMVQSRWGPEIRAFYETALQAGEDLTSAESPMRDWLRVIIRDLSSQERTFKIYCHRRARPHFESLFLQQDDLLLPETKFLHSLREYREAEPFDFLIKAGPLRARGWGSAPDAFVTAPRFGTLAQIVWSSSNDDPDFGYDPILPAKNPSAVDEASISQTGSKSPSSLTWEKRVVHHGEDPGELLEDGDDADDLRYLQNIYQSREKRSATLVQIDGEQAVLYPPYSQVLSFDPDPAASNPIDRRVPDETLHERMFLIRPSLDDVDLGHLQAKHGSYSQIWKGRLEHEFRTDPAGLIYRLQKAGLGLVHLRSAIGHWCEPPTSVIHAPQQIRHFEILIQVLGLESKEEIVSGRDSSPWWQLAWVEIRKSRGEAVRSGFIEKEIVDEQLLAILEGLLPRIREKATSQLGFRLDVPPRTDVHGDFLFLPIIAIEHGFHAPGSELKIIHQLKMTDKWRD